jgi:3-dehydroquinate synthetase
VAWHAGAWLHGEAVSAGTVMAADLSHRLGWIDKSLYDRARDLLELANLPVVPPKVGGLICLQTQPCSDSGLMSDVGLSSF